jgi:hypothetical protein
LPIPLPQNALRADLLLECGAGVLFCSAILLQCRNFRDCDATITLIPGLLPAGPATGDAIAVPALPAALVRPTCVILDTGGGET